MTTEEELKMTLADVTRLRVMVAYLSEELSIGCATKYLGMDPISFRVELAGVVWEALNSVGHKLGKRGLLERAQDFSPRNVSHNANSASTRSLSPCLETYNLAVRSQVTDSWRNPS